MYGFYDECLRKFGSVNVWRYCTEIFDYLSLAALIDDKVCMISGPHCRYWAQRLTRSCMSARAWWRRMPNTESFSIFRFLVLVPGAPVDVLACSVIAY